MNVLIVDDHPMMLEYLSGAAGRAFDGAKVRTAGTIEDALATARDWKPDLALLDLGLPGCGGIESLLRFRQAHPSVRAIVISAEEELSFIRGALAAGAQGYIPKTTNPRTVVHALRLVV